MNFDYIVGYRSVSDNVTKYSVQEASHRIEVVKASNPTFFQLQS